ncbi:uncharacterized protein [Drosophila virilis]|nr:tenascin [Drosophila virilis]
MRCCKSGLLSSTLVVLVLACVISKATAQDLEKPDTEFLSNCVKGCSLNDCQNGECSCKEGFYRKLGSEHCVENVCIPQCLENQKCSYGSCTCVEGYENYGVGGAVNCSKPAEKKKNNCPEDCGLNGYCLNTTCICKEGFYKKLGQEDCVENVCIPQCLENQKCSNGSCTCIEGHENYGVGGAINCSKPLGSTEIRNKSVNVIAPVTHSTTTTTTTSSTTTTPPATSTQNPTSTTITTSTENPTTTQKPKEITTSAKPTPKPKPHTRKSGMSPWAITGIIFLVACLVGFGGFMLYRHKQRGAYRATSTTFR